MNSERLNRITFDPEKCGGRPCIRGMRIRVTDVLELLAFGASFEEILSDYPSPLTVRCSPLAVFYRCEVEAIVGTQGVPDDYLVEWENL